MLNAAGFVCGHLAAFALLWSSCLAAGIPLLRRVVFRDTLVEAKLDDAAALAQELRRMKADYFLLDRGQADVLEGDDRFRQLFRTAWSSRTFEVYRVPGGRDCSTPDTGGTPSCGR